MKKTIRAAISVAAIITSGCATQEIDHEANFKKVEATMFKYFECVMSTGHALAFSSAEPSEIARAAHGECQPQHFTYEQALAHYTQSKVSGDYQAEAYEHARKGAAETRVKFSDRVVGLVIKLRESERRGIRPKDSKLPSSI